MHDLVISPTGDLNKITSHVTNADDILSSFYTGVTDRYDCPIVLVLISKMSPGY